MKIPRTSRLDSEFRKEIADIISRDLKDREPGLSGIISVTEVSVAPDLKTAKAYISIYAKDDEKKKETYDIIEKNAGFIRHCLSKRMKIRTVPLITFLLDASMEYGSKIDELLKSVHKDTADDGIIPDDED